MKLQPLPPGPDYATVLTKLRRANDHSDAFSSGFDEFFGDGNNYETSLRFDHNTGHIDVYGRLLKTPPVTYLGSIFGDALNCLRSALDHLVWALSIRYQARPGGLGAPPPDPIARSNPWRKVGFPIVTDEQYWGDAQATKLGLIDPKLHAHFKKLQPFTRHPSVLAGKDPTDPAQAWLAMLDALWNIDKHRVIHIGNLTVALETLNATWKTDGRPVPLTFTSSGPQVINLDVLEAETYLGRITDTSFDDWPGTPDEMEMERGRRVNQFLDPGQPGFGRNMKFALGNMHNTVVMIAWAFEPEFR